MADDTVTTDDLKGWYSPGEVFDYLSPSLGPSQAQAATWGRVQGGLLRAAASRYSIRRGEHGTPKPVLEPMVIPTARWARFESSPYGFWRGEAQIRVSGGRYESDTIIHCFDIRLDPADVEREFPDIKPRVTAEAKADAPPIGAAGGGRPRAWWREPLLIELAGQLHDLTLEPKNLADLERAAHVWLAQHDEYGKETTVRTVVTPLWQRISKGAKNPKR